MKFLIVEDEPNLQKLIGHFLKREEHLVESAVNFKEAFQKVCNYEYDCVVLDLNLPDGNGLNIIPIIRQDHPNTAIIIVSARDSVEDKVFGLDKGADDYLIKPFSLSELNARIKAIIRRKQKIQSEVIEFGDFKFYVDERRIEVDGKELELTKKEYEIMIYMLRNKNRIVTKDSIAEHLWGDYMDETDSFDFLYAHLKNLRKKLSKLNVDNYLSTIYGVGYKFSIPNK